MSQSVAFNPLQERFGDTVSHTVAEGDGPVNALDAAMRKALNGSFPSLREMHLVDYKVRVINSEAGTAVKAGRPPVELHVTRWPCSR